MTRECLEDRVRVSSVPDTSGTLEFQTVLLIIIDMSRLELVS